MRERVASCPFCRRKYDITGLAGGSRIPCEKCHATLVIPRAVPKRRPFLTAREGLIALVSGSAVAAVMFLLLRGGGEEKRMTPSVEPSVVKTVVVPVVPAKKEGNGKGADRRPSPDGMAGVGGWERKREDAADALTRKFGVTFFNFDASFKPYLLAIEKSDRYYSSWLARDYREKLQALYRKFSEEFGEPLGLREIADDVLVVIVLKDEKSFQEYQRNNDISLSSQVNGFYDYGSRCVVAYYDNRSPFEVIFHEGIHQLVDHHSRRRSDVFWFHEGLANCFEGFRWRDGGIVPDEAINRRRAPEIWSAVDAGSFVPLRDFVKITTGGVWKDLGNEANNAKVRLYHAQAWALAYFLRNGAGGKYRQGFSAYFRAVLDGRGGLEDFIRAFDSPEELEKEFSAFVKNLEIR